VDKPCPAGGIRVAVFADGKIRVDDKPVNVNEVSSTLRGLARSATEVCLHRENPDAPEPHPNMLKVLDAIVALKLPIAFYFDAAFQRRVALE
jgi:biopolymer transport protein ExbD